MARETAQSPSRYYYRNASPITAAPYTIASWAYSTNRSISQNVFCINRQGQNNDSLGLVLVASPNPAVVDFFSVSGGVGRTAKTVNTYSLNTWQHVCGVAASATDRKVYLNGDTSNKGTSTDSSVPNSLNRVTLGAWFGSAVGDRVVGGIAECALWNVALTEGEVVSLSTGMAASRIRPQSLVFYFPGIREVIDLKNSSAITSVGTPGVIAHPRIYV
jgi:hypothetical protein